MKSEGPSLAAMMHRLAECPEDFLTVSEGTDSIGRVSALLADFFRRYGQDTSLPVNTPLFTRSAGEKMERQQTRYLGLVGVALWLFYDSWFDAKPDFASLIWNFLNSRHLVDISRLLQSRLAVSDPDRREEMARICLNALGLRPAGETATQATDRLTSLNSIERERILRETVAAEKRAREVREAMAAEKARESVSRYGE